MSEYWYHIFVCVVIQMMGFVTPVEDIRHIAGWRRVNDSGRDYIGHVSVIFILRYP